MQLTRRELAATVGVTGLAGVAGCSGNDSEESTPGPETEPTQLLPEEGDNWSVGTPDPVNTDQIDAVEGMHAEYTHTPEAETYVCMVLRWDTATDAAELARPALGARWSVVRTGVWSLGARGRYDARERDLLERSSAVTTELPGP